jgi:hypothetical protein
MMRTIEKRIRLGTETIKLHGILPIFARARFRERARLDHNLKLRPIEARDKGRAHKHPSIFRSLASRSGEGVARRPGETREGVGHIVVQIGQLIGERA